MTLGDRQREFTKALGHLIVYAYTHGYELTFGDGLRRDGKGHRNNSLHYVGLAQDLNLFRDGVYLTETEDHKELGLFWESLGGSWGGRFGDGNHYSFEWEGRK